MRPWQKTALTMLAGVVGGALGMLTVWSWFFFAALFRFSPGLFWLGAAFSLSLPGGAVGAMIAGWWMGRYFEKQEDSPPMPRFRDRKQGGMRTQLIRYLVWLLGRGLVACYILLLGLMGHPLLPG